jgi:hypothetical protein
MPISEVRPAGGGLPLLLVMGSPSNGHCRLKGRRHTILGVRVTVMPASNMLPWATGHRDSAVPLGATGRWSWAVDVWLALR